jgi:FMN phosphatase YigB (HAD superfamily)
MNFSPEVGIIVRNFLDEVKGNITCLSAVSSKDKDEMKAVLFDLDNTLILYDEAAFYGRYFSKVSKVFRDLMTEEEFVNRSMSGIKAIFEGDGEKTNADIFLETFTDGLGESKDVIWGRFMSFYDTGYDALREGTYLPESVQEVFGRLENMDVLLVLASNPIFPRSVLIKRLAWGGLERLPFHLITHIENMRSCKPKIEYYLEISSRINVDPGECLMVGNDPLNDMAAALAGMKTFLTTDAGKAGESAVALTSSFHETNNLHIPEPDFQGPLSGVVSAVNELKGKIGQ